MEADLAVRPTAVILAGGLGVRLREVVADRPKVLALVGGRPFLHYVLQNLQTAGIRKAVLCVSYLASQVREVIGTYGFGMDIEYSIEAEPLGTGGALRQALPHCGPGPLLVVNGDSLFHTDLPPFFQWHLARKSHASLLLAHVADASRFGRVNLDEDGRVMGFVEKDGIPAPGWINAGIYLLEASRVAGIPEGRAVSLERECFPAWISQGLHALGAEGAFLDIGTPESYRRAEDFLKGLAPQEAR